MLLGYPDSTVFPVYFGSAPLSTHGIVVVRSEINFGIFHHIRDGELGPSSDSSHTQYHPDRYLRRYDHFLRSK